MSSRNRRSRPQSPLASLEFLEPRRLLDGEPLAVNDQFVVSEDSSLQIAAPGVLLNDVGGGPLSATVAIPPQHGALTLAPDGSFHYQPSPDFFGEDSFSYQAFDGKLASTPATVKLTVLPVADGPASPQADVYFARQDTPLLATGLGRSLAEAGFNDALGIGAAPATNVPYSLGAAIAGQGTGELGWAGPWVQNEGAVATVSADSLEGDGALLILPTGLTARQWQVADPNAPFSFEMRMKFTPAAYISLYLFDGAGGLTNFNADAIGGPQLNIDEQGNVAVVDGGDSEPSGIKIEPGQWHTMTFRVDPVTQSYRFFFDNVEAPGPDPFKFRGTPAKVDSIAFIPQVSGTGILVDAIQIYQGHDTPGVLANERNVDALPLSAQLETGPAHASAFKLNADGTFAYTPTAGFIGQDSFTYRLHDGGQLSPPTLVTIFVQDAWYPPVAADDAYVLDQDSPLVIVKAADGVLKNDTDADGDALTAEIVAAPAHGQLELLADGRFTYTPAAGFHGADVFSYRATDGKFASNVASVQLTVAKVDRTPVVRDDLYTVNEDGVLEAAGGFAAPEYTADFSGNALPAGLEGTGFQVAGGVIRRVGASGIDDRSYIRTVAGDFLTRDFLAEISFTTSLTPQTSILYFGLGSGLPLGAYQESSDSVHLRLHTPTTSNGHVGITNSPANDTAVLGHITQPGLHRARFEKVGQTLRVSVDANYTGHFAADLSYTIADLGTYAPFLNGTNAHLFFGTALSSDSFDDFTISPLQPSGLLTNDTVPEDGPAPTVNVNVPGTSNLWLAGLPNGSTASVSDSAPAQSPVSPAGLPVIPGQAIRFSAGGEVSNGAGGANSPDGSTTFVQHGTGAENGLANLFAPLNSLIGVFLDDESPTGKAPPAALDFRPTSPNVPNGIGYGEIQPLLRQPFFIGDGLGPDGTPQQVRAPAGATRLFLATMDSNASFNNTGVFAVAAVNPAVVPSRAVLVSGPAHGTLELQDDGDFRYVPAPDYFGPDSFQYKLATRYGDSAVATASIVVTPVADAPEAQDEWFLVDQNTPLVAGIGQAISADAFQDFPASGFGDGTWSYRYQSPSLERDGDYPLLEVRSNDDFHVPHWSPDSGDVFFHAANEFVWVAANQTGGEMTAAAAHWPEDTIAAHPPGNGLVVLSWLAPASGIAELEFGFADADPSGGGGVRWHVELNDQAQTLDTGILAEGTATALLHRQGIAVKAGDRLNFIIDPNGEFAGDTTIVRAAVRLQVTAGSVLENDTDRDADPLMATLVDAPTHGQVALGLDGKFTYTPAAGYLGPDSFTYRASDGALNSNLATVHLTVVLPLPGDVNGDGKVDLTDFGRLKESFGSSPANRGQGDLNGDQKVDLSDFGLLKANFGQQGSRASAASVDAVQADLAWQAAVDWAPG